MEASYCTHPPHGTHTALRINLLQVISGSAAWAEPWGCPLEPTAPTPRPTRSFCLLLLASTFSCRQSITFLRLGSLSVLLFPQPLRFPLPNAACVLCSSLALTPALHWAYLLSHVQLRRALFSSPISPKHKKQPNQQRTDLLLGYTTQQQPGAITLFPLKLPLSSPPKLP